VRAFIVLGARYRYERQSFGRAGGRPFCLAFLLFPPKRRAFWHARSYDFNVWTTRKRVEKLRYMHRNPVKRGLVGAPEEWEWSSYRFYLLEEAGPVQVNEGWTKIWFRDRVS
jgi:REP element-mobilizing transposase RayT